MHTYWSTGMCMWAWCMWVWCSDTITSSGGEERDRLPYVLTRSDGRGWEGGKEKPYCTKLHWLVGLFHLFA